MRVESTDGQHQEVGLYVHKNFAAQTLMQIRQLPPLKPWQFGGGMPTSFVCNIICSAICRHAHWLLGVERMPLLLLLEKQSQQI